MGIVGGVTIDTSFVDKEFQCIWNDVENIYICRCNQYIEYSYKEIYAMQIFFRIIFIPIIVFGIFSIY